MSNTLVISIVAEWKMGSVSNDIRSRESIGKLIDYINMGVSSTNITELKDEAKKSITSSNQKRDFNNSLNIAIGMRRVVQRGYIRDITHLEVATMKKVVGLFNKVEKREDLDTDDLLDPLSSIIGVGVNYNNSLCITINKITHDIAPEVGRVSYKEATVVVEGLSKDDKEKLLKSLMSELGYEVA